MKKFIAIFLFLFFSLVNSTYIINNKNCTFGCTLSQGYWKNTNKYRNPPPWPTSCLNTTGNPTGFTENNTFLNSGKNWYFFITQSSYGGEVCYSAGSQLIAAWLNICDGACVPPYVQSAINNLTQILSVWCKPTGLTSGGNQTKRNARSYAIDMASIVEKYNTGIYGPGECLSNCNSITNCNTNLTNDCNNNTIKDILEINSNSTLMCDNSTCLIAFAKRRIPKSCCFCKSNDCNSNLIPDKCDLKSNFSSDFNNNSIPDECEVTCCQKQYIDDCGQLIKICLSNITQQQCVGGNFSIGSCPLNCNVTGQTCYTCCKSDIKTDNCGNQYFNNCTSGLNSTQCGLNNFTSSLNPIDCSCEKPFCETSCCLENETCVDNINFETCQSLQGNFSNEQNCSTRQCSFDQVGCCCIPNSPDACGFVTLNCTQGVFESQCNQSGGVFSLQCPIQPPPPPCFTSCCLVNGTCVDSINLTSCLTLGGSFNNIQNCSVRQCPQPLGCCLNFSVDNCGQNITNAQSNVTQSQCQGYWTLGNCPIIPEPNPCFTCCRECPQIDNCGNQFYTNCISEVNQSECNGNFTFSFSPIDCSCPIPTCTTSCCLNNGTCVDNINQTLCDNLQGLFNNNENCSSINCSAQVGCCTTYYIDNCGQNITVQQENITEAQCQGTWNHSSCGNITEPLPCYTCCKNTILTDNCGNEFFENCTSGLNSSECTGNFTFSNSPIDCSCTAPDCQTSCCLSNSTCFDNLNQTSCDLLLGNFSNTQNCSTRQCPNLLGCCTTSIINNCNQNETTQQSNILQSQCNGTWNPGNCSRIPPPLPCFTCCQTNPVQNPCGNVYPTNCTSGLNSSQCPGFFIASNITINCDCPISSCITSCCLPNNTCAQNLTQNECQRLGGSFGLNKTCQEQCPSGCCSIASLNPCNQLQVTCLQNVYQINCNGSWNQSPTCANCTPVSPPCQTRCCLPFGVCANDLSSSQCNLNGGTLFSTGGNCVPGFCPTGVQGCCKKTIVDNCGNNNTQCLGLFMSNQCVPPDIWTMDLTCSGCNSTSSSCLTRCCLQNSTCLSNVTSSLCSSLSGSFSTGIQCSGQFCPAVTNDPFSQNPKKSNNNNNNDDVVIIASSILAGVAACACLICCFYAIISMYRNTGKRKNKNN